MSNVHEHDINTPIHELMYEEPQAFDAYQAEIQRRNAPQDRSSSSRRDNEDHIISKGTWEQIDRSDRGHWVKMLPKTRALILNDRVPKKAPTTQSRTPHGYPGITAKTHDLETAQEGSNDQNDDQEPGEIIASTHRQQLIEETTKSVRFDEDSTPKKKSQSSSGKVSDDSDKKKKVKDTLSRTGRTESPLLAPEPLLL